MVSPTPLMCCDGQRLAERFEYPREGGRGHGFLQNGFTCGSVRRGCVLPRRVPKSDWDGPGAVSDTVAVVIGWQSHMRNLHVKVANYAGVRWRDGLLYRSPQ